MATQFKLLRLIFVIAFISCIAATGKVYSGALEEEGETNASLDTYLNDSDPQNNDLLGTVGFYGNDDMVDHRLFAQLVAVITDVATASADGLLTIKTVVAGTMTDLAKFSATGLDLLLGNLKISNGTLTVGSNGSTNYTLPSTRGTTNQVLTAQSAGATAWTTLDLSGDVSGPVSSTNNGLVRWDGTSGNLIKDTSTVVVDSNGRMGIGITSPDYKLDVRRNITTQIEEAVKGLKVSMIHTGDEGNSSYYTTGATIYAEGHQEARVTGIEVDSISNNYPGYANGVYGAKINATIDDAGSGEEYVYGVHATAQVNENADYSQIFGGHFEAIGGTTGEANTYTYGIYASASGDGPRYAGYFDEGNVVLNSGNLGIGEPYPFSHKLQVVGSGYFSEDLYTKRMRMFSNYNTASAPAYSFNDDLNTGMYRQAADTLAFATGGVERMRINSNGNIGIGTTSTSNELMIETSGANNPGIELRQTSAAVDGDVAFYENGTLSSLFRFKAGGGIEFQDRDPTSKIQLKIDSAGKVGIGTDSPLYLLHVEDTTDGGAPTLTVKSYTAGGSTDETAVLNLLPANNYYGSKIVGGREGDYSSGSQRDSFLAFHVAENEATYERVRINSAGYVGIGTTTLPASLTVKGAGTDPTLNTTIGGTSNFIKYDTFSTNSAHNPAIELRKSGSNTIGSYTSTSNGWPLGTVGFLGVNTAAAGFSHAAYISCWVDANPTSTRVPGRISFNTTNASLGNVEQMRIANTGQIYMYNLSDSISDAPLYYDTSTKEIGYDSSSIRFKENVENFGSMEARKLLQVQVRKYDRINKSKIGEVGAIAEEVDALNLGIPGLVTYDPTYTTNTVTREDSEETQIEETVREFAGFDHSSPHSINWYRAIPVMLKLIQDQQKEIDQLNGRLNSLESRLSAIERSQNN